MFCLLPDFNAEYQQIKQYSEQTGYCFNLHMLISYPLMATVCYTQASDILNLQH
jgi:hypothetical protein